QLLLVIAGGLNRLAYDYINPAWPGRQGVFGQQLVGATYGDGDYRHAGPQGNLKRPGLELLQAAVGRACALRKDGKRLPGFYSLDHAPQAMSGLSGIAPVDRKVAGRPQMPSHERDVEQLLFGHYSELKGQVRKQGRDIDQAGVICHIDIVPVPTYVRFP